jgi:hypothetical protein
VSTNMKEGYGILMDSCGYQYEGYWKDDHPHGQGKEVFSSGDAYDGMFINSYFSSSHYPF